MLSRSMLDALRTEEICRTWSTTARIRLWDARPRSDMPENGLGRKRKVRHHGAGDSGLLRAGWVTV
jgi:hypothetical protein